jgi:hypothetical protein
MTKINHVNLFALCSDDVAMNGQQWWIAHI